MDIIYHAVKNLLKSLVNLFAAILELITDVVNWLASCLRNFYPHISGKYAQIHENRKRGVGLLEQKRSKKKDGVKKEVTEEIRSRLKEEVTGREQYYTVYLRASEDSGGLYAMFVSVLGLILAGGAALVGRTGGREIMVPVLAVMAFVCGAVCIMIYRHRKKTAENRLAVHILETEFKDMLRDGIKSVQERQTVQEEQAVKERQAVQEEQTMEERQAVQGEQAVKERQVVQEDEKEQTQER